MKKFIAIFFISQICISGTIDDVIKNLHEKDYIEAVKLIQDDKELITKDNVKKIYELIKHEKKNKNGFIKVFKSVSSAIVSKKENAKMLTCLIKKKRLDIASHMLSYRRAEFDFSDELKEKYIEYICGYLSSGEFKFEYSNLITKALDINTRKENTKMLIKMIKKKRLYIASHIISYGEANFDFSSDKSKQYVKRLYNNILKETNILNYDQVICSDEDSFFIEDETFSNIFNAIKDINSSEENMQMLMIMLERKRIIAVEDMLFIGGDFFDFSFIDTRGRDIYDIFFDQCFKSYFNIANRNKIYLYNDNITYLAIIFKKLREFGISENSEKRMLNKCLKNISQLVSDCYKRVDKMLSLEDFYGKILAFNETLNYAQDIDREDYTEEACRIYKRRRFKLHQPKPADYAVAEFKRRIPYTGKMRKTKYRREIGNFNGVEQKEYGYYIDQEKSDIYGKKLLEAELETCLLIIMICDIPTDDIEGFISRLLLLKIQLLHKEDGVYFMYFYLLSMIYGEIDDDWIRLAISIRLNESMDEIIEEKELNLAEIDSRFIGVITHQAFFSNNYSNLEYLLDNYANKKVLSRYVIKYLPEYLENFVYNHYQLAIKVENYLSKKYKSKSKNLKKSIKNYKKIYGV